MLHGEIAHRGRVREAAGGLSLMVRIIWCVSTTHSCNSAALDSCCIADHLAFPLTHFETGNRMNRKTQNTNISTKTLSFYYKTGWDCLAESWQSTLSV